MADVWIFAEDALPAEGERTLIVTRDLSMYISKFESRKVSGNDTVPYGWYGPGPFSFFGAQVLCWMPVPELPRL